MSKRRPHGPGEQKERDRFILNLRMDLGTEVRELAAKERRSLNSQVELLIERGLRDWPRMAVVVPEAA